MEGFTKNAKMQCFKTGGAVKYKSRHSETKEMEKDIAQDKTVVKKAFKMHDAQSHEGDKTDLSKLKKGGRIKKCGGGNVRKYKKGGPVKKADGGLMGQGAISDMERRIAMKAADSESAAKGQGAISDMEKQRQMDRIKRAQKHLGPAQQGEFAGQEREFLGRKKGGKVKKYADGGDVISQEAEDIIRGKRPVQAKAGEMTPAERRASIAKAFGAKAAPEPAPAPKMKSRLQRDAEELQELLGKDVNVTPVETRKCGGSMKKSKK